MTASTTTPASPTSPKRLTTAEVDVLRVRALQGDPLAEVREPTREWVWRSLLLGTHLQVCAEQAGLASEAARAAALDRVRGWYRARLAAYHQVQRQAAKKKGPGPRPGRVEGGQPSPPEAERRRQQDA